MGLGFTAPLIAADNHMIKRPVKLDSGLACHGCESRKKEDIKSILIPLKNPLITKIRDEQND